MLQALSGWLDVKRPPTCLRDTTSQLVVCCVVEYCSHTDYCVSWGHKVVETVPWRLVDSLSPRKPWFASCSVHMGFVVNKVAVRQVFSDFFGFPLSTSFRRRSSYSHVTWGMTSRPDGDHSSETMSQPIDMNKISFSCVNGSVSISR
jgi:hypothetical protein